MYLSIRHRGFLLDYLRTLDLFGCEERWGFVGVGLDVLNCYCEHLEDFLDSGVGGDFNDSEILDELRLLLADSSRAGKAGFGARVKALELLGKYRGMWTGKGDESGRSDIGLGLVELDGVEQYIRLETGSGRVLEDKRDNLGPYRVIDVDSEVIGD